MLKLIFQMFNTIETVIKISINILYFVINNIYLFIY